MYNSDIDSKPMHLYSFGHPSNTYLEENQTHLTLMSNITDTGTKPHFILTIAWYDCVQRLK